MRIISNFHDYYDCVQKYGQDQSFIYLRNPETFEYDRKGNLDYRSKNLTGNFWPFLRILNHGLSNEFYLRQIVIGFCGKIYPVLEIKKGKEGKLTICYNTNDIDDFIEKNYAEKYVKEYYKEKKNCWSRFWYSPSQRHFNIFFDKYAEKQDNYKQIFIESRHPIFVAYYRDTWYHSNNTSTYVPSTITFNVELKKLEFYRIFPTSLAYQEISMYLGGVLGQGNPVIPEISNNDMIEAKGFDLKSSFRKEKSKKKRRKIKI